MVIGSVEYTFAVRHNGESSGQFTQIRRYCVTEKELQMDRRSFIAALTVTVVSPLVPVFASESELEILLPDEDTDFETAQRQLLEEVKSATCILTN